MKQYVYGVDVGGTNIKLGLFDVDGMSMIDQQEILTPNKDHDTTIFQAIYTVISNMNTQNHLSFDDIKGVGLAVPCPVKNGFVKKCPNLKWSNFDIAGKMKTYLPKHIKVVVSNDATVAAFGENMSLEKPYMNAVFYTLGTGVGGGIIIDGKILEGGTGLGGEIGHMHVYDEEEETCGCGSQGCLEQICGTSGILNATKKLAKTNSTNIDLNHLTVKAVFDAAKNHDEVAFKVVNRVAEYIAISASILAVTLDPEVFIIGGGVSKAGEFLIELIVKHYKKHARFSTADIPFILARTGNSAGIIGAAYISMTK